MRWVRESVTKHNEIRKNKTAVDERNETQEMSVRRQIAEKDGLYFVTSTLSLRRVSRPGDSAEQKSEQ